MIQKRGGWHPRYQVSLTLLLAIRERVFVSRPGIATECTAFAAWPYNAPRRSHGAIFNRFSVDIGGHKRGTTNVLHRRNYSAPFPMVSEGGARMGASVLIPLALLALISHFLYNRKIEPKASARYRKDE